MAEYNYSNEAATAFLTALLAYVEMAKACESKHTSIASSGVTSHLQGVAVASPHGSTSRVHHSAIGDPAVWPLQNSNGSACTCVPERSTISSSSVTPFSTRFPDKNNNDSSPLTISITIPTSGSKNNFSVAASYTAPAPVNAPTVVPVQRPVQKGNGRVAHKTKRISTDNAGQLEDRIAEDTKGDIEAWLEAVYERFFVVFPAAADQGIYFVKMELENNELKHVEHVFQMTLFNVPNVILWAMYSDYIRRQKNLTRDTGENARAVVNQNYEFLLNNVRFDREPGGIWTEYIEFVKSSLGRVGGSSGKTNRRWPPYERCIKGPLPCPFEERSCGGRSSTCSNKARKHLQEYSPMFITARYCLNELSNIAKGLRLDRLSRLAPAPGYDGYHDYSKDPAGLRTRIIHVFNQALIALRFWPEMWFDAAEWCFANGIDNQGGEFLNQGMVANPESCILYFKYAERLEATIIIEGGEEALIRKGEPVSKPHDQLRNRLYELGRKIELNEKEDPALIADAFELTNPHNAEDDSVQGGQGCPSGDIEE
ncbi:hypothetical protein HOY82DRAFT_604850 [Tuber indicum]|nr:hypothetical protein HOY82DRAFT_604850 [Tuber indicum]